MRAYCLRIPFFGTALGIILPFILVLEVSAQSTASIEGQVFDQDGAVIPSVKIVARSAEIGVERETVSDTAGRYLLAALPVGDYTVEASTSGFKKQVVESVTIEVSRRLIQDFQLEVGDVSEQITITSSNGGIERSTMSVGHVIDRRMVQDIPLNGRYFLDLGLLVPG